ncbi:uncharacterized protein LOC105914946 [Setaria italica]|uniref:uncharacterized protein LOC105914946 n=1 Tax=Setaria italica TaxID=4555 RepID=UPI0006484B40|nr:uncharacterized protein LOC105914946 [Setaria italica]
MKELLEPLSTKDKGKAKVDEGKDGEGKIQTPSKTINVIFGGIPDPVVAGSRLTKVLIVGGSGLNSLFAKTLKKMGFNITEMLTPTSSPFYGIVPGNTAIPLGQVVLLVIFGTKENYRTEYIQFEVADFEVLSLHGDLKRSYECDTEAVELAMSQVPTSMQQVFIASKKLSPTELEIPENKSRATKVKLASGVDFKAIDLETGDTSKTALINTGLDAK